MKVLVFTAVSISLLACSMDRDPPSQSRTFDARLLRRLDDPTDLRYAVVWVRRDRSLFVAADRPLDLESLEFEVEFLAPPRAEASELAHPRTLYFGDRSWVWTYQPRLLVYRDADGDQTLHLEPDDAEGGNIVDELVAIDVPVGGSVAFIPEVARQVETLTDQGRVEYYEHTGDRLTPFVASYASNDELRLISTFYGIYLSANPESRMLEDVRCGRNVTSLPSETQSTIYVDERADAEVLCEATNEPCSTIDLDALPNELAEALASVTPLFGAEGNSNSEASVTDAGASQPAGAPEASTAVTDAAATDASTMHDASVSVATAALDASSQRPADAGLTIDTPAPTLPNADSIAHCRRAGSLVTLVVSSATEPSCEDCSCTTRVSQQSFIASESAVPEWWPCGKHIPYCEAGDLLDPSGSCTVQALDSH